MRFALVVALLIGCQPDLDGTAFRCDATHGCPDGQSCISGRCRRVAPQLIGCGPTAGDVCLADQQCCVDVTNPPRCIAAADECPGSAAICDSIDDCASGEHCCNGAVTACGLHCENTACHADLDCPSTEPHCCPQPIVPWGECRLSC